MYKVKKFFQKIKRVFQFIPIAWNDEDWDYDYLLELIKFKCEKMRSYFRKSNILCEKDSKEIIVGLNRTLFYIECYRNPEILYKNRYGEFKLNVGYRSEPCENGCYRMISINKDTKEDLTPEEDEKYSEYLKKRMDLEQESWNTIFKTISEEGQKWWD